MVKAKQFFCVFIVLGTCSFSLFFGLLQFGGYDLSLLIDLQSRLYNAEVPGIDFINTLPLTMSFFLKCYGFIFKPTYLSLFTINITIYLTCCLVVLSYWPKPLTGKQQVLSIILVSIPTIATNHIWHSSLSQLLAVAYAILALNYLLCNEKPLGAGGKTLLALFAGLAFFSKQNIGLPITAAIMLASVFLSLYRRISFAKAGHFILLNVLGIAAAVLLFVLTLKINLYETIQMFISVLDRAQITPEQAKHVAFKPTYIAWALFAAASFYLLKKTFSNYTSLINGLIALCFTILCIVVVRNVPHWYSEYYLGLILIGFLLLALVQPPAAASEKDIIRCICLATFFASLLPMATDWDIKFNNVPVFCLPLVLSIDFQDKRLNLCANALVLLLIFESVWAGVIRERMRLVGYGLFFEYAELHKAKDGYFAGLEVPDKFLSLRSEIQKAVALAQDKSKIFCGPRIEFCYIDNALPSPNKMPIWWHPGSSYPLSLEPQISEAFQRQHFSLVIFLKDDRTRLPIPILEYIAKNYIQAPGFDLIDVFLVKQ